MERYNTTNNYKGELLPTSKCPSPDDVSSAISTIINWNAHQKGELPLPVTITNGGCNPKVVIGSQQDHNGHMIIHQRDFDIQEADVYLSGSKLIYQVDAEIRKLENIRKELINKGVK